VFLSLHAVGPKQKRLYYVRRLALVECQSLAATFSVGRQVLRLQLYLTD
jgi:hypothetical protein